MKKVLSKALLIFMSFSMLLCFTACGNTATEEQKAKMDTLMTKQETLVKDCENALLKYPSAPEQEEYTNYLNQTKTAMEEVKNQSSELRKIYDESRDSYTPEQADEVITALENQISESENFLKELNNGLASLGK